MQIWTSFIGYESDIGAFAVALFEVIALEVLLNFYLLFVLLDVAFVLVLVLLLFFSLDKGSAQRSELT